MPIYINGYEIMLLTDKSCEHVPLLHVSCMSVTKSAIYKYLAELTAPVISLSKQLPNDIPIAREKPEETGFI
jgi:hypothetical protein